MTNSELQILQKFISGSQSTESELSLMYNVIQRADVPFEQLIHWLKRCLKLSYDFEFLSNEATLHKTTRRDIRNLLEIFAEMFGNKIQELCDQEIILTVPTKLEDYCPFPSAEFVIYTTRTNFSIPRFDGYTWRFVRKQQEETPYYSITCYEVERI